MLYVENLIKDEIQLAEDECCIVFDFGCYFPYSNPEVLVFDFSLGMETIKDYKLNKRYSNKCYQTISRKYGRKVSKVGYPYVMKINEHCICNRIWKNYEENSGITVDGILLNPPVRADEDSNVLIYDNVIEPFPLSIL